MNPTEFLKRVAGPGLKAALEEAAASKTALDGKDLPFPPLYIYFNEAGGMMTICACFRPGFNGLLIVILESEAFTGTMVFNADVEWNDGDTLRTGWIYTPTGPFTPAPMFLPDFPTGADYATWQTTLPYTPGTLPSGSEDPVMFSRFAVGATQA